MINFYNHVPLIYTSASRDFQYLSWLINIVLNYVKHNVDDMYDLPNTKENTKLVELLAMTLGFKLKRNYDQKQLAALVSIFPSILKYKGTERALTMAGEALINASGSTGSFKVTVDGTQLEIVLPEELIDTTLFIDLLDYILPAGMTCRIVRNTQDTKNVPDALVEYSDIAKVLWCKDATWDSEAAKATGLSSLFAFEDLASDENVTEFGNTKDNGDNANIGLLDNTVIPAFDTDTTPIN